MNCDVRGPHVLLGTLLAMEGQGTLCISQLTSESASHGLGHGRFVFERLGGGRRCMQAEVSDMEGHGCDCRPADSEVEERVMRGK